MTNEQGFTLIEVIAAMAILVLVLMAFLPVFPQTLAWAKSAESELVAGQLLGRVAHDIRMNPEPLDLVSIGETGEQVYRSEDGSLDAYPPYAQPVELTVRFDAAASMYLVKIEVLDASGHTESDSYVYIGGAP